MAVEIPVVIDIEGAFADAAKRVPAAMRPLAQSIEGLTKEMNKWQDKVNRYKIDGPQWKNAVNHVQALSHALEIASDRFMYFSTNEGSLRRLNGELAITVREWEKMGAAQKFDKTGQLSAEAQQLYQKYKDITQAIRESGKTLQQMEAEEKKILSLKAQGQQSRRYENAILNTTVKTMRVLSEQERILTARLQSAPVGSQKFVDLSAKLKQVRKEMQLADAQVRRGGAAYRDLGAGAATARTQIQGTSAALATQGGILKKLSGYLSGYMLLFAGIRFIKNVRETTAELELQKVALASIVQNADLANDLFRQIKAAALKSPFEIKDLVTYTKQLAAYRIEEDKLFDVTMRLADVSAGLGVDMNRLVLAYGQVRAAAVLRGQELRQFTEAGIPLVDLLAKKFQQLGREGTTTADVFELISKRAVSFSMIEEIFNDMTSAGGEFYKMQEKQSETLKGQWMKLKDSITIMYDEIGNTTTVHNAMSSFIKAANNLARSWQSVGNWIKTVTAAIITYNLVAKASVLATNSITKAEAMRLAVTKAQSIAMPKFIASIIGETAAKKASAVASKMLEVAQYRLATATTLTGKAFWGLWAAIVANPYAAVAAGLAALGLGIYTIFKNSREAAISVDDLEKALASFKTQSDKTADNARLIKAYEDLSAKAEKTADDQERLGRVTKELAKTFPSAVDGIDKETGALKVNIEKVKELTRAEQELELNRLKRKKQEAEDRIKELEKERDYLIAIYEMGGRNVSSIALPGGGSTGTQFTPLSDKEKKHIEDRVSEIREELEPFLKLIEEINGITLTGPQMGDGGNTESELKGWKEALMKIQEEKVKAGAAQIFTPDDINQMKNINDLWKKTKSGIKETKQELDGLRNIQTTLTEDKKKQNEEDIKFTEKQLEIYEAIKAAFGFVFGKESNGGGGYHQDPFINKMQERIKFMQDFEKGYKKLSEYMTGESALDKQFAIMEKRGMSLGLDATEQKRAANELSKWYEDMRATAFAEVQKKYGVRGSIEDFLRQEISDTSNRGKALKDFQKLIQSLWDAQTDLDTSNLQKTMEDALKKCEEEIKRSEVARNFFNDIFELTGDEQLATDMAVSVYGDPGKEFADRIQASINGALEALDINEKNNIGEDLMTAINALDFKTLMARLNELPEKLRKPIKEAAEATEKYNADIAKSYVKLLNKFDEMQQQRVDIENKADKDIKTLREGLALELKGIDEDTSIENKDAAKSAAEARVNAVIEGINREKDLQLSRLTKDYRLFFSSVGVISEETARKVANNQKQMLTEQFVKGEISLAKYKRELNEIDKQLEKYYNDKGIGWAFLTGGSEQALEKVKEYADSLISMAETMKAGDGGIWTPSEDEKNFLTKIDDVLNFGAFSKLFQKGQLVKFEVQVNVASQKAYNEAIQQGKSNAEALKEASAAAGEVAAKTGNQMSAAASKFAAGMAQFETIFYTVDSFISFIGEELDRTRKEGGYVEDWGYSLVNLNKGLVSSYEKFKSGDMFGALISLGKGIQQVFHPIQPLNNAIEDQADLIDRLEYSYSRLEYAMSKSFGSEYIYNYNKQLEILEAKAAAYTEQARLEREKGKNMDAKAARAYEQSAQEIQDKIMEMQTQLSEYFSGTNLTSAAEDFANAWIDAYKEFGSTTDAMSEKFNDMINSMINRSLAAKIMQEMLQPVFDQIDTMARDGLLSTEEIGSIAALAQERIPMINDAMTNLMASLAAAGLDVRTSTAGFKGISKSIAGASEESILGLAAAVNTQNFYMSYVPIINENVAAILSAMTGGAVTGSGVNLETTENGEVMPSVQKMIYDHLPLMDQNLAELLRLVRSVITTKNGSTNTNYVAVK